MGRRGLRTWLAGTRAGCAGTGGVMALRVNGTARQTAWCSATISNPSPPAVSSNGHRDAVLWLAGTALFADAPPRACTSGPPSSSPTGVST